MHAKNTVSMIDLKNNIYNQLIGCLIPFTWRPITWPDWIRKGQRNVSALLCIDMLMLPLNGCINESHLPGPTSFCRLLSREHGA